MVFPVVMYRCESWALKKAEHWKIDTFVWMLENTFENLLDSKEIKSVNLKGNQPWIFIGRTDAEAEVPILWSFQFFWAKNQLIGKDSDAGKNWRQEEKGMTEDDMVGWHQCLNGHKFEKALGDGEGQGSLACCSPWGWKKSNRLSDWTTIKLPGNKRLGWLLWGVRSGGV